MIVIIIAENAQIGNIALVLLNTILPPCQAFSCYFEKYLYLRNDSHFETEMKMQMIIIMRSILIYKTPHKTNNNMCKLSQQQHIAGYSSPK